MDQRRFLNFINFSERLKNNTRHSWTSNGRHESVAEHSWRLMLMAYLVRDEYPDADIQKVMLMCLFHDIGEAVTGDIPAFEKDHSEEDQEAKAVQMIVDGLPEPYDSELEALFAEMDAMETLEAKIFKALDKMEAIVQHNQADLATWQPNEYAYNLIYGEEEVQFSPWMIGFKQLLMEDARAKVESGKAAGMSDRSAEIAD